MEQPPLIARYVLGPFKTKKAANGAVKDWLEDNPNSYYGHEIGKWRSGLWAASVYYFPNGAE